MSIIRLWSGDCIERLAELKPNSVGAVICDPPYDLDSGSGGFMGRDWDATGIAFDTSFWSLVMEILCPGGLVTGGLVKAFGGTRTFHRVCRAMERVGFQDIHLTLWIHGQGFPKSTDISKRIDKQAGVEREIVGYKRGVGGENLNDLVQGREVRKTTDEGGKGIGAYGTGAKQVAVDVPITAPATDLAKLWEGYGTALKPAWEPIVCAKKSG